MNGLDGQIELLPSRAPEVHRASLHLADLEGFEHAWPSRELVELIGKLGLLQPLVVTAGPERRYRVIEGRRRAKAIGQLEQEGRWPSPARVDALIVEGVDGCGEAVHGAITLALHAARSASPMSELHAIEAILDQGGELAATIKQIAAQTGMPVQTVQRRLRLRGLSPALRAAFEHAEITISVAEAAARLSAEQQATLEQAVAGGERVTLDAVRAIARRRTSEAVVCPAGCSRTARRPGS